MISLRIRNKLMDFLVFFAFSALTFFFFLTIFSHKNLDLASKSAKANFFSVNFSIFSIFSLLIYSLVSSIFIRFRFKKTECFELIFFAVFLFAVLFEGARLWFAAFALWRGKYLSAEAVSRVVIFSKSLASLSLFSCVAASHLESSHKTVKAILALFSLSFCFSSVLPVNTLRSLPTFENAPFSVFLPIAWIFVICFACFSLFLFEKNRKIFVFFCVLCFGYLLLCCSSNWILFLAGTLFLYGGTFFYLNELHFKYLW